MTDATWIVHWPGKDTPACDAHAEKLIALGKYMGFFVSKTPAPGGLICLNCVNEEIDRW